MPDDTDLSITSEATTRAWATAATIRGSPSSRAPRPASDERWRRRSRRAGPDGRRSWRGTRRAARRRGQRSPRRDRQRSRRPPPGRPLEPGVRSATWHGRPPMAHARLDVLVHCAAVYTPAPVGDRRTVSRRCSQRTCSRPFLLTNLLLDRLRAAPRARVLVLTAPSTVRLDFDDLQGERRFRSLTAVRRDEGRRPAVHLRARPPARRQRRHRQRRPSGARPDEPHARRAGAAALGDAARVGAARTGGSGDRPAGPVAGIRRHDRPVLQGRPRDRATARTPATRTSPGGCGTPAQPSRSSAKEPRHEARPADLLVQRARRPRGDRADAGPRRSARPTTSASTRCG